MHLLQNIKRDKNKTSKIFCCGGYIFLPLPRFNPAEPVVEKSVIL